MISYLVRKNKDVECVFPQDVQSYAPSTDQISNILKYND